MSTILREFDLTFAPGYLENTEMVSLVAAGNFEKLVEFYLFFYLQTCSHF